MAKRHVISIGGSIIVPDSIDIDLIKRFSDIIRKYHKKGHKFAIFTGGGRLARNYINAAKELGVRDSDELDEIGIKSTLVNAELIRASLGKIATKNAFRNPRIAASEPEEKVVVCGGWKPGSSTDYDAVIMAVEREVPHVINLTNVDYVYDKDPKKYRDAQKLKEMKWEKMLKITGSKWKPGLSLPFDPKASKLAYEKRIKVIIANGNNLKNFENIISGKPFIGTTIS